MRLASREFSERGDSDVLRIQLAGPNVYTGLG